MSEHTAPRVGDVVRIGKGAKLWRVAEIWRDGQLARLEPLQGYSHSSCELDRLVVVTPASADGTGQ